MISDGSATRTGHAKTARSRRTRALLVDAVRSELSRSGEFTATAAAHIAGCTEATFFAHFGTKDAAIAAVFDRVAAESADLSARYLSVEQLDELGLSATISEFVEAQSLFFADQSSLYRCVAARFPHHRPLREIYRSSEQRVLGDLETFLIHGQDAGMICSESPTVLAETLLVLGQGLNNPHCTPPGAHRIRAKMGQAIVAILQPQGADACR